jgi:serine/threonine protein phosphatase PrpC
MALPIIPPRTEPSAGPATTDPTGPGTASTPAAGEPGAADAATSAQPQPASATPSRPPRESIAVSLPGFGAQQSGGPYVPPPDLGPEKVHPYAGYLRGMPEVEGQPADIELDGADLSRLHVRAASLRGSDHQFNIEPRQDSIRIRQVTNKAGSRTLSAVVSDGVGSQPLSHLGSRLICDRFSELLGADGALDLVRNDGKLEKIAKSVVRGLVDELERAAKEKKRAPKEYSATMVAAVVEDVPPNYVDPVRKAVVLAIGDACAYVLRHDGAWEDVHDPKDVPGDLVSTGTDAMPGSGPEALCCYQAFLSPGDMLLICTDGLANPMRGNAEVKDRLAFYWRGASPRSALEFGWQVGFRAKSHGDDRSAICIWAR